jgi:hypothetical protein
MDDFKCLSCGSPRLVLSESVESLQDSLDILLYEMFP